MSEQESIRAILVDDESKARSILKAMLEEYCPQVQISGEAEDLSGAVRLINKEKPQVVFLDIEMPGLTGLQLLDFFNADEISFDIIFTTAYSQYAVDAFRLSAVDYLLKPIQIDELERAVAKINRKSITENQAQLESLKINLKEDAPFLRIAVPVSDGLLFINTNEIIYIKASGAYSEFILSNGSKLLVSKNLKEFEKLLRLSHFVRPHRSYIANLHYVKQLLRKDGGYLIMDDGAQIHISPTSRDEVIERMESIQLG
ncbi:response regulator transcription factor [bacterium]|nr:MAG: response regulator transcription factor [bacterium]